MSLSQSSDEDVTRQLSHGLESQSHVRHLPITSASSSIEIHPTGDQAQWRSQKAEGPRVHGQQEILSALPAQQTESVRAG